MGIFAKKQAFSVAARRFSGLLAFILLVASLAAAQAQQRPGRREPPRDAFSRQFWLIPSTIPDVLMHTTVLRPQGRGPFPLVLINHGSTANAAEREGLPRIEFEPVATWFVGRGYVVALPQRPGHGETGGVYLESIKSCDNADYQGAGLGAAASIEAAVDYLTAQPFVRKTGVVLVGHSAGGWGALAAASKSSPALAAVINFAGGLGGHSFGEPNRNCAPGRLLQAAAAFGRTTRVPTLWLYAANDTYFNAALSKRMADAFGAAGGVVEYHLLPSFGPDGHFLMLSPSAVSLWAPIVARFLHLPVQ